MQMTMSEGLGTLKRKAYWTTRNLLERRKATQLVAYRPFPEVTGPYRDLKQQLLDATWGMIQQQDKLALMNGLEIICGQKEDISICELGVAAGMTGNQMTRFAKAVSRGSVRYFGIDDLSLTGAVPRFEFEDCMTFFGNIETAFANLGADVDFALVDACHCSECVYHDSIAMSQQVTVGGLMAFHDTSMACQFPNSPSGRVEWQHYGRKGESERPLAVLEGIAMARPAWRGTWKLIIQEGDHLSWGGVRIFKRLS